jgi:arsenate reductase
MNFQADGETILIVCTGNSCRSIMAEAMINQLAAGRLSAFSAGSAPTGVVHPDAIRCLQRHGYDVQLPRSKSWDEFRGTAFDYLVTVCDGAAGEVCPVICTETKRLHWSIPDPAQAQGSAQELDCVFDGALRLLEGHLESFLRVC